MKKVKISTLGSKKILVGFIFFIVLLLVMGIYLGKKTIPPTSSETWSPFSYTPANFKILFPVPNPEKTTDTEIPLSSNLKRRLVQFCESIMDDGYCIEVGIYPPSFAVRNDYYALNDYKDKILTNFKNPTLISSSSGEFLGVPDMEFVLKDADYYYKYRIFVIGDNSYGINSGSKDSKFENFNKFADSFSLIKPIYGQIVWKPLSSDKWGFKTLFPETYSVESPSSMGNGIVDGVQFTSDQYYQETISLYIYDYDTQKVEIPTIDYIVPYINSLLKTNYKIVSKKNSTCQNYPCTIFLAQQNDMENYGLFKGELITVGSRIYLIFEYTNVDSRLSDIDKVMNSFQLTK